MDGTHIKSGEGLQNRLVGQGFTEQGPLRIPVSRWITLEASYQSKQQ